MWEKIVGGIIGGMIGGPWGIGIGVLIAENLDWDGSNSKISSPPLTPPPEKLITFIGPAGIGKSTTINELTGKQICSVSAEKGTTRTNNFIDYVHGYQLCDTPGLFDHSDHSETVWSVIERSELVIYTTIGQLYSFELEFLELLHNRQSLWNSNYSSVIRRRRIALFLNQHDIKKTASTTSELKQERDAIKAQVRKWISSNNIVFGASRPIYEGRVHLPDIDEVKTLIDHHITFHSK